MIWPRTKSFIFYRNKSMNNTQHLICLFFLHENAPKYCMLNFKTPGMKTASIYMKTLKWVYTFYLYLNSDKY